MRVCHGTQGLAKEHIYYASVNETAVCYLSKYGNYQLLKRITAGVKPTSLCFFEFLKRTMFCVLPCSIFVRDTPSRADVIISSARIAVLLTMQTCPVNDLIVLKTQRGSTREWESAKPTGELAGALGRLQNHRGYISTPLLHHWMASNLAVKNSFVIRDYLRAGLLLPTTAGLPTGHRKNTWGVSSKPSSLFYRSQTERNYSGGTRYAVCEIKQRLRDLRFLQTNLTSVCPIDTRPWVTVIV